MYTRAVLASNEASLAALRAGMFVIASMKNLLRVLSLAFLVGCAGGGNADVTSATSSTSSTGSGAGGAHGTGGGHSGPCAQDCSALKTDECTVAVCNTGQIAGPTGICVVIPAPDGSACEDGFFCTAHDTCQAGTCMAGPQNDCGLAAGACSTVTCHEDSKSCSFARAMDGTACTPANKCEIDGACQLGVCVGQPKDCSFSPTSECNTVVCDPSTGQCMGTPDPTKDGATCVLTGDLCSVDKACSSGQCVGGKPKDCSGLDVGCQVGGCQIAACDKTTGLCGVVDAPMGTVCTQGLLACQVGACGTTGTCVASPAPDGTACNDHDACTQTDVCSAGACAGTAIASCQPYFQEGFETCPDGWTFGAMGDWACGAPASTSPVTPHTGHGVIATSLSGLYANNESYDSCTADSPVIDLTKAVNPAVFFWAWVDTEGGTYDGWNIKSAPTAARPSRRSRR